MLILGPLMSAIFEAVALLNSFCEFSGKQIKVDLSKQFIPCLLTHHGVSLSEI